MESKPERWRRADGKARNDSESDSDSLEYSNDDQSDRKLGKVVHNEQTIQQRPPVHPLAGGNNAADLSTPDRKGSAHSKVSDGSGPLHFFSPGLSPIRAANVVHREDASNVPASAVKEDDGFEEAYIQDLNRSIDSLDMAAELFVEGEEAVGDGQRTPNYQFWKDKLFGAGKNAAASEGLGGSRALGLSFGSPGHDGGKNTSVDSDMYITKQSLIYPTTEAVYKRSSEPKALNLSIDSDVHVEKQSLVYPTTARVYLSSEGAADVSALEQSHLAHLSMLSFEGYKERESELGSGHNTGASNNQRSAGARLPAAAAGSRVRPQRGGQHSHSFTFGDTSLMNASASSSFDQDLHDHSLRSISLLPGSPNRFEADSGAGRPRYQPQPQPQQQTQQLLRQAARSEKKGSLARPSAAAVRLKQLVTSSDTEFVSSTSRKKAADLAATVGAHARDTSDLRSPTPVSLEFRPRVTIAEPSSRPRAREGTAQSAGVGGGERGGGGGGGRGITSAPRSHLPAASHGSHHGYNGFHGTANGEIPLSPTAPLPAPASSGLVVGSLYTLLLDANGCPAFVPVLGAQLSSPMRVDPGQQMASAQSLLSTSPLQPAPPAPSTTTPTVAQYEARVNPYRLNFGLVTSETLAQLRDPFNSNGIDLEKVLDRALHRGSLSAERLDKRFRESLSPPTSLPDSAPASMAGSAGRASSPTPPAGAHSLSPVHKKPSTKYSSPGLPPRSPFQVGLTPVGTEQLLPSARYWKERLHLRSLTSVLPVVEGGVVSPMRLVL